MFIHVQNILQNTLKNRCFWADMSIYEEVIWCPGAESNHRHEDFQSTALPLSYPGTGSGGWPPLGLGLLDKGRGGGKREKREFSEV